MSTVNNFSTTGMEGSNELNLPTTMRPLHRLGVVRRLQGITRRTIARHLNLEIGLVRTQEQETTDILLSRLYEWQKVLDVPIGELLVEANDPLSAPVLKRAQLVRVMKTALAIINETKQVSVRRMAQTLIEQLLEIMPELEGVSPWHTVGKRRRRDDYGVAAERRLSEDVFMDLMD